MADKLPSAVNRASRQSDVAPTRRVQMYELDPKKEYTQTKFDADQAAGRADQEDDNASRSRYMQGYAKGGQVGKVGSFGMKRSKPDFGAGGPIANRKSWSK